MTKWTGTEFQQFLEEYPSIYEAIKAVERNEYNEEYTLCSKCYSIIPDTTCRKTGIHVLQQLLNNICFFKT